MKRRVLHVLDPEPDGNVGGADLHVADLAPAQRRDGRYEPAVLLLTEASAVAERLREEGVEVIEAYRMGRRYAELPFRLRPTVDRLAPDLLHSHGYDANYFACWSRMAVRRTWARRPLVFTSHGWIDRPDLVHKTWLDLFTHRFSDHVIICSPHQHGRARRAAGHDRITFVCNGVPAERAPAVPRDELDRRFGFPPGARLVAFVGRLSPEKQVTLFLDIARRVGRSFPDVHFVIAGGGPLEGVVRRRVVAEPELAGRVTLTGVVGDIDSVYGHIDLLVVPSTMETTSRVTIEALMWGVPVVASDVGGLPSLITPGEVGFLCPSGDVEAFTRRVRQLLAEPRRRGEMGARGRARARERFTVEHMCRQVEDVYDAVLDG
jgi:glycosyltransferase involved in cell wall biosynthesis